MSADRGTSHKGEAGDGGFGRGSRQQRPQAQAATDIAAGVETSEWEVC